MGLSGQGDRAPGTVASGPNAASQQPVIDTDRRLFNVDTPLHHFPHFQQNAPLWGENHPSWWLWVRGLARGPVTDTDQNYCAKLEVVYPSATSEQCSMGGPLKWHMGNFTESSHSAQKTIGVKRQVALEMSFLFNIAQRHGNLVSTDTH